MIARVTTEDLRRRIDALTGALRDSEDLARVTMQEGARIRIRDDGVVLIKLGTLNRWGTRSPKLELVGRLRRGEIPGVIIGSDPKEPNPNADGYIHHRYALLASGRIRIEWKQEDTN